ncbi:hypothetical protein ACIOWK_26750, partial [Pseudomonas protegens]|uniref:hypothetical protein n=1 Tax=Pseudomonas protegens TaxID=380021 RepID=UPI00381C9DE4
WTFPPITQHNLLRSQPSKLSRKTMDFSQSKKTFTEQDQKAQEARKYLQQTDWLVVRKLETGKEVPADIAEKRAEARSLI